MRVSAPVPGKKDSVADKPAPPPVRRILVEPPEPLPISPLPPGEGQGVRASGVPKNIGRFEVQKRLGAGAFGQVYRARDPLLDREIALKVPHASTLQSATRKARVLVEAKAAGQLRHPNIVPVYEVGQDGETYYIASAFIEGQTLEDAIDEKRPDFRQAAKLVMDLAGALHYAHQHGVVHRDVKPANIMLDAQGDPLVMDFGLARLDEATSAEQPPGEPKGGLPEGQLGALAAGQAAVDSKLTREGTVMGTAAYMAPEQAWARHDLVGPASDQYSLGVVLYELLCGSTPFAGPQDMVLSLVRNREPDSPRTKNPAIPKDLEAICLKAMAKQRESRYANCQALAEDLRRWLTGEPVMARRVSPVERFLRWCLRNPAVSGLAGAAAFLLTAVALVTSVGYVRTSRALEREALARTEAALAQDEAVLERHKEALARKEAVAEKDRADASARQAQMNAQQAEASARKAEANANVAETEKVRAEQEKLRAEQSLYHAQVVLANQKWLANEIAEAESLLDSCTTQFRHWEWGYLKYLCHLDLLTLRGHTKTVARVSFSSDGKRIVSASDDEVIVWDAATGQGTLALPLQHASLRSAAYSADGKWAATSHDDMVKVRNAATGQETFTFRIPRRFFGTVSDFIAISVDGTQIAKVDVDEVKVWDATTGRETFTLKGHGKVTCVAFSADRKRIASGSEDGTTTIWDAITGREVLTLQDTPHVNLIALSPDGKRLATGASNAGQSTVNVWDTTTGREVFALRGHKKRVNDVAFGPDGKQIVSGSDDNSLKVWDTTTGRELFTLRGSTGNVEHVGFTLDGNWIVGIDIYDSVRAWDATTGENTLTLWGSGYNGVSPDGKRTVSWSMDPADNDVRVNDAVTDRTTLTLRGHTGGVNSVAFSPDGKRIASGASDGTVWVWDATTGKEAFILRGHTGVVTNVSFSPDGKWIVSASDDKTAKVWDAAAGRELFTLPGHTEAVTHVAFSPNGKRIASASADNAVKVWNATTGRELFTLRGHAGAVINVAFSPDGKRIASASDDNMVKVWDATVSRETLTLTSEKTLIVPKHCDLPLVSPDGKATGQK